MSDRNLPNDTGTTTSPWWQHTGLCTVDNVFCSTQVSQIPSYDFCGTCVFLRFLQTSAYATQRRSISCLAYSACPCGGSLLTGTPSMISAGIFTSRPSCSKFRVIPAFIFTIERTHIPILNLYNKFYYRACWQMCRSVWILRILAPSPCNYCIDPLCLPGNGSGIAK